jgi:hypothetical protein
MVRERELRRGNEVSYDVEATFSSCLFSCLNIVEHPRWGLSNAGSG